MYMGGPPTKDNKRTTVNNMRCWGQRTARIVQKGRAEESVERSRDGNGWDSKLLGSTQKEDDTG